MAGGAGFPTHVKLNSKVKTLIANAASCEPLVTSDFALMLSEPDKVLKGMSLVMDITNAEEGIIAIKGKHKDLIKQYKDALKNHGNDRLKIHALDDFYPAGDEFILVYEITGKVIPERALPLEVGCLVQNVTTLAQIYDAYEDKPVTRRYVTITGEVKYPQDILLPIGISFEEAINPAGGPKIKDYKIIHGGPMMGPLVDNPSDTYILKTTSMILVLPEDHLLIQKRLQPINTSLKIAKSVCCQCSMCTDLCPRGLIGHPLEPHKIMRTVAYNLSEPPENITSSYICSECGLCSTYACTMGIQPHKVNIELKAALIKNNYKFERIKETYEVDDELRNSRKVPTTRLMSRLGLSEYKNDHLPVKKTDSIPATIKLKLQQHIGAKSEPIVKKGQQVNEGDVVATIPLNKLGAKLHASITGKVSDVNKDEIVIKG